MDRGIKLRRVAIQGEQGSYSECAALDFFHEEGATVVPCRDYPDLFRALNSGDVDCMVIPIENSSAGSVYPYYDLLLEYAMEHGFRIASEHKLRIRHNLIAHLGVELSDLTEVWSHFQALDQCAGFMESHGLRTRSAYDTAGAVKEIMKQDLRHVGAVASVQAAIDSGMNILAPNIQDQDDNYTRFLHIGKLAAPQRFPARTKSSVVFCIPNVEGSLFRTMAAFGSRRDVTLIRIESRPLIGTSSSWRKFARDHKPGEDQGVWDLLYYVDFIAPGTKTESVIEHLRELVLEKDGDTGLQVLGYYDADIPLRDITGVPWRK
jgi:prephenate dehydratase